MCIRDSGIKDCKSMNMLPALLVPPLFFVLKGLFV